MFHKRVLHETVRTEVSMNEFCSVELPLGSLL